MKVTGERFIPGRMCRDGEIEHYHRYIAARKLVTDKTVLDAACGTGYGSKILSAAAKKVCGIDLSEEAVLYARQNYGNEKTDYQQASIAELPFPDRMFDVVVSFETIEHVDKETQKRFLSEIRRVLKEDGILIMSSPNKKIFTDGRGLITEFHIRELYEKEFISFLADFFPYYKVYNQYFSKTSTILGNHVARADIYNYDYDKKGMFFIAVASAVPLGENDSMDSSYYYPEEYAKCNDYLQIYFSENGCFLETDSVNYDISNRPGIINDTIEIENTPGRFFRIDPGNESCKLQIENVIFVLASGQYLEHLDFTTNADEQDNEIYTFYHKDPQIIFDLGQVYEVRSVTVQIKVLESDFDLYPDRNEWKRKFEEVSVKLESANRELSAMRALENTCTDLKAALTEAEHENKSIKEQNETLSGQWKAIDEENRKIKQQNICLARERDQKNEENRFIKAQNEALLKEGQRLDEENHTIKAQNENLLKEKEAADKTSHIVKAQNEELARERDSEAGQKVLLEERFAACVSEKEALLKEQANLTSTIADLNAVIADYEQKLRTIEASRMYQFMKKIGGC